MPQPPRMCAVVGASSSASLSAPIATPSVLSATLRATKLATGMYVGGLVWPSGSSLTSRSPNGHHHDRSNLTRK